MYFLTKYLHHKLPVAAIQVQRVACDAKSIVASENVEIADEIPVSNSKLLHLSLF